MNKNDILLIIIVLVIVGCFYIFKSNNNGIAYVYYNDELIKEIDLSNDGEYSVKGYNGDVVFEVKDNKIRVKEEVSPRHLCSKEGYSDVIACLPNKIIVKVNRKDNQIDGVVK